MIKNTIIIFSLLLLAACSADVVQEEKVDEAIEIQNKKNRAMEHFVDGAIAEQKGQVAEAILEYQDALKLDSSAGIHYALSKGYFKLNKLSLALQHAKSAVKMDSSDVEYNELLAKVFSAARQTDSAETVYQRIISLDSNNVGAYFNLGLIYEDDKPMQALEIYKKLIDITGPEWNILVKIADINERMGNIDETVNTVEELLALNPSSLELQKMLIESYIKTERFEDALKMLNEALTLFPDDINLIEFKANTLIQKGEWKTGSEEYIKLVKSEDVDFDTKTRIAGAFLNQAIRDSSLLPIAKEVFEEINKDSVDWQINVYLGEIAVQENRDSTAVEYFRVASDLAEWNNNIWVRLGGLLFDNRRYSEAAEEMEKAVKNFPNDFVINFILGLSYAQEQKHELALPYLYKAADVNPTNPDALSAYGFTLNQLGKTDEALESLKKALNLDPDNAQNLGMLGMIYDGKEMWEECDSAYEKALAIDSSNALLLNNYAYSLAERGIQLERALKMVTEALEKEPENSSYLDTKGWVFYQLGDYQKAKEYVEKSLKINSASTEVLDHLGDIYFQLGDTSKALEYWSKALEKDKDNERIQKKIEKGSL